MARYDKYEPKGGGFRAPLAADWAGDPNTVYGVGLDANGRVVPGAGQTGVVGVLVVHGNTTYLAGDVVDVMTDGEVVDFGGTAGTVYYAAGADGVVSTTNTGTRLGHTVEGGRLIVRAAR